MHRSGTSLTARLLALLGAYLGPSDELVAAAEDNPSGFWEFRPIVELNAAILQRLGGRAFAPPMFERGWEKSPELEDLRAQAKELIQSTFGNADIWAWKDPRTCLTLPFWQLVASPTHYVVCVRNPAEVAKSIERRDGVLLERSLYLWLTYTRAAISSTATERRTLIAYDRIIDNPLKRIAELAQFIGTPERAENPETLGRVAEFVDGRLRHHAGGSLQNAPGDNSDPPTRSLKAALRAYEALLEQGLTDGLDIDGLFEEALAAVPRWAIPAGSAGDATSGSGAGGTSTFSD